MEAAVVSALVDKADIVRKTADRLGFEYQEEDLKRRGIIRFHFFLSPADSKILASEIPFEVYAFKMIVGP